MFRLLLNRKERLWTIFGQHSNLRSTQKMLRTDEESSLLRIVRVVRKIDLKPVGR
jgi:hypothetical protein